MKTPKSGDMIRIAIGEIYHYGIYVSDEEIIQFGPPPITKNLLLANDIKVISTDINGFICGCFLEVGVLSFFEKMKAKKPKDIVAFAKSKIGTGGYNLLYNNCEHFVNECVFGVKKCSQVDDVRELMQKIPKTDVCFCEIPHNIIFEKLFPEERQQEIESCTDEKIKKQKYCVWKLLAITVKKTFGVDIENTDIHKNNYGKWCFKNGNISLSHNDKYAVAAVSNYKIGVDVESVSNIKFSEKLLERIATEKEKDIECNNKNIAILWTKKESIFKKEDKQYFYPKNIDTALVKTESYFIDNDNVLTIACDNQDNISINKVSFSDDCQIEKINLQKG